VDPRRYLVQRRMERAGHLLLESDLTVAQIARLLGYHNAYFFARQFKGLTGQPPATFRRGAHDEPGPLASPVN
jgi:AraC family transcriptional regulator, arabinose operon regulatory protein